MQSRGPGEGMDGRRKKDGRVPNPIADFGSKSRSMEEADCNMILEVPDTPDRTTTRHLTSSRGNNFKLDGIPNYSPLTRAGLNSRHSNRHNSVGISNASDDADFYFLEANLARQLSRTSEAKPSFESQSKPLEPGHAKISDGSARSRRTIDLSCKSPVVENVCSLSENCITISPSADDKKIEELRGNNAGLKYKDKGKGIDLSSNTQLRNGCTSPCNVEKSNIEDNGKGTDLCRDPEFVNGQPRRTRSAQRRLVRNGRISPLNIERSRNIVKPREVNIGNNGNLSHTIHIISPDSQDKNSSKMKGKATVGDIVASNEQSAKDRSCANSVSLTTGKELAATPDAEGGAHRLEDKGWITTRNHTRKSSAASTWNTAGTLKSEDASHSFGGIHEVTMANTSSVNVVQVNSEVPPMQHGTNSILIQDSGELQKENGRVNGKRKLGSSRSRVGECSSSTSNDPESLNFGSSRQTLPSGSARSRRSQRGGLTLAPVIEVDELQSPEASSNAADRHMQVESDEMLARQLQEELYNETAVTGNIDEAAAGVDTAHGKLIKSRENDGHSASISRQNRARRRDLPSSSLRSRLWQNSGRETFRSRVPTSSRLAQMRRELHMTMMDLNRRFDIIGTASFGDAARVNNILHMQRDFNEDDYELLLALDENNHQHGGASDSQISNLPQSVIQNADSEEACAVCLEPPSIGDTIRHLPCLHKFHKDCIDAWLRRKRSCPICKSDIR
ncbi:E3 ubiquitin-protein ligase RNF6 isoform X2 [Asparagus officinalis]|uniref:E3 ubiquitin-protein ligase RNF6 isoform X2 n=1 Tax=Asparagus officinalis TaxID=4686 RepID=UPI00098E76C4|nr:E3 ubiquitin-protein ligase RNF6 isoform X2 [Asparagus officinalis]